MDRGAWEATVNSVTKSQTRLKQLCVCMYILYIYMCVCVCIYTLVAQMVKNLPAMQETWVQSLGQKDPLKKEIVTHSSILVWRIPWTEEPGGYSLWRRRVRYD